jgi:stage II sporulation protein D
MPDEKNLESNSRRRFLIGVNVLAALVLVCGCTPPEIVPAPAPPPLATGTVTVEPVVNPVPTIRVKLGEDAPEAVVKVHGAFRLADLSTGRTLLTGARMNSGHFAGDQRGLLVLNGQGLPCPRVEIIPADDGTVEVLGALYHGRLRLLACQGQVRMINAVELEKYLPSVVGQEMYPSWHLEALKAQAVAARSYALYEMRRGGADPEFDLFATQKSQAYPGLASETDNSRLAVAATRGLVLVFDDGGVERVLPAFYHSTCGGHTVDAAEVFPGLPGVAAVRGVVCGYCTGAKCYRWQAAIPAETFRRQFRTDVPGGAAMCAIDRAAVRPDDLTAAGRVRTVSLWTAPDNALRWPVSEEIFKRLFPPDQKIRSDRFSVSYVAGHLLVSGSGYGHGVGMCQFGAESQAAGGRTAVAILSFYYPAAHLARAY